MKPSRNKVIITCAITGSVHTPSMSPHLPVTPDEIAQAAIEAAEAGAAIVHLHARQPGTGQPTQDPALYAQFLPRIKEASDVVINITTGGSPIKAIAALRAAGAEVAAVAVVVDRATGAREAVEAAGLEYRAVFGLADLGL